MSAFIRRGLAVAIAACTVSTAAFGESALIVHKAHSFQHAAQLQGQTVCAITRDSDMQGAFTGSIISMGWIVSSYNTLDEAVSALDARRCVAFYHGRLSPDEAQRLEGLIQIGDGYSTPYWRLAVPWSPLPAPVQSAAAPPAAAAGPVDEVPPPPPDLFIVRRDAAVSSSGDLVSRSICILNDQQPEVRKNVVGTYKKPFRKVLASDAKQAMDTLRAGYCDAVYLAKWLSAEEEAYMDRELGFADGTENSSAFKVVYGEGQIW